MTEPEKAKILWLIRENNPKIIIGFLRDRFEGCFIIGGPTGSHYTGHGEEWKSKWKQYLREGYIDVDSAKKSKSLSANWRPPKISARDQVVINDIVRNSRNKHNRKNQGRSKII